VDGAGSVSSSRENEFYWKEGWQGIESVLWQASLAETQGVDTVNYVVAVYLLLF
jgi:hypothetical protein